MRIAYWNNFKHKIVHKKHKMIKNYFKVSKHIYNLMNFTMDNLVGNLINGFQQTGDMHLKYCRIVLVM